MDSVLDKHRTQKSVRKRRGGPKKVSHAGRVHAPWVGQITREIESLCHGHCLRRAHAQHFGGLFQEFYRVEGGGFGASLLGLLNFIDSDRARLPHEVEEDMGHFVVKHPPAALWDVRMFPCKRLCGSIFSIVYMAGERAARKQAVVARGQRYQKGRPGP